MITNLTFKLSEFGSQVHPYAYWDNFFTDQELEQIKLYCNKIETDDLSSKPNNETVIDTKFKKSKTNIVTINEESYWIFEKLKSISETVNNEFFKFDLVGFDYLEYNTYGRPGDFYDFHTDSLYQGFNSQPVFGFANKLTFTLLLSDPDEYTGGDFEIFFGEGVKVEQQLGRIIAFPSFIIHKIHPIKVGKRRSIDYRVVGPKFK